MSEATVTFAEDNPDKKHVKTGKVFESLLATLNWDEDAKESFRIQCSEVLARGINSLKEDEEGTTGLIVGKVQSGKTLNFTGLIALLSDNDFKLTILLTGTKKNLKEQTIDRLYDDLQITGHNWRHLHLEADASDLKNKLSGKRSKGLVIFPLLKHWKHIAEFIQSIKPHLGSDWLNNVVIIDDESDQASHNTLASKDSELEEMSSTYEQIFKLKQSLVRHLYFQYTATPQAPLLIEKSDILSPDFHFVLETGKGYIGGKELFNGRPNQIIEIPDVEVHHQTQPLEEPPTTLVESLRVFILAAIIKNECLKSSSGVLSMMIHPDSYHSGADLFANWSKRFLQNWRNCLDDNQYADLVNQEFERTFRSNYERTFPDIDIKTLLYENLYDYLTDVEVKKIRAGSSDIDWDKLRLVIVVGGELLNRGYTVEGLVVTYMPRHTKGKTNADTLQQRARFFGYKNHIADLIRVYLPEKVEREYRDYVADEESIHNLLRITPTSELSQTIAQSELMRPTRSNILSTRVRQIKLDKAKAFDRISLNHLDENNRVLRSLLKTGDEGWEPMTQYGHSATRLHRSTHIMLTTFIKYFADLKFHDIRDRQFKTAALHCFQTALEKEKEEVVCLVDMSFTSESIQRSESTQNNSNLDSVKINQVFSGKSSTYPGDDKIIDSELITVQLYNIEIKNRPEYGVVKTLAVFIPNHMTRSFVSTLNPAF